MGDRSIPTIHIQPTDSPSPSPVPEHVRPRNIRHSSNSSTASSRSRRPHAQQQEYVPSGEPGAAGLGERWQFEQAEHEAENSGSGSEGEEAESEEEAVWDNLRDGSVSRRPAWRRPSPAWIYPFIIGATLSLGMGVAPKSELYINLACLVVAPRQSEDTSALRSFDTAPTGSSLSAAPEWLELDGDMSINSTLPRTLPPYHPSPADEWFKKIQREMYDYEINHGLHINGTSPRSPPASPSSPSRPKVPKEGNGDGTGTEPDQPEDGGDEESTPSSPKEPPYHEIDPRTCKHDPKVQAATAKLSMSRSINTLVWVSGLICSD
jgi:hypothetical protein